VLFLFVVLGAWASSRRWSIQRKPIIAVEGHFKNLCKLIIFKAVSIMSQVTYPYTPPSYLLSSFYLFMPNYAPAALLPSAAIKDKFELTLSLGVTYLVNEGFNFKVTVTHPNYAVRLGRQFATSFLYEVEISGENVSLNHRNFLEQLFVLAPVSSLV